MARIRDIVHTAPFIIALSVMLLCSTFLLFFHILPNTAHAASRWSQTVLSVNEYPSFPTVQEELKKAEIIPTVIDDFIPVLLLNVTWSRKEIALLGNTLKPRDLSFAPTVSLYSPPASNGSHLTILKSNPNLVIIMTDPDAPSREDPKWSEFCHWIARGIPQEEIDVPNRHFRGRNDDSIEEIVSYKPPGPPPGTGKHRYVFLALSPVNGTSTPLDLSVPNERRHWGAGEPVHGVREWAEDNGLAPIAANFIYAQH